MSEQGQADFEAEDLADMTNFCKCTEDAAYDPRCGRRCIAQEQAIAAHLTSLRASQAALVEREKKLTDALNGAREAIAAADPDTWGTNATGDASVPGGFISWPIKDEILHHIDAALAQSQERT